MRRRRKAAGAAGALRPVVTRPDDGREHELVAAFCRRDQLGVAQLDRNLVTRQDVRDVHLKDVWPLLLEQRAGLAFALGGGVLDARTLLFLDARSQQPVAEPHVHRVHRRLRRARKHIARLDRPLAFVAVDLRHADIRDDAGDAHIDACGLQRQPVDARVVARDVEVRSFGARRLRIVCMRRQPGHEQQCRERGQRDREQYPAEARQRARPVNIRWHEGPPEVRAADCGTRSGSNCRAKRVRSACARFVKCA